MGINNCCCTATDHNKSDLPRLNRVERNYNSNNMEDLIINPKKMRDGQRSNSEEFIDSPLTPKLQIPCLPGNLPTLQQMCDLPRIVINEPIEDQQESFDQEVESPANKYQRHNSNQKHNMQDDHRDSIEDSSFFISDHDRKLYEKVIENSKIDEFHEGMEKDLSLFDDLKTLVKEEGFIEVYNDKPKYDEKYDNETLEVKVFMKDVYISDHEDNKFVKTLEEFDLLNINPKNYFFLRMFIDEDNRSKIDRSIEKFNLFYLKEIGDKIFYVAGYVYKASIFPSKDEIVVGCFKSNVDGSYCSTYKSFRSSKFPVDIIKERVNVIKSVSEFKKCGEKLYKVRTSRICDRYSNAVKLLKPTLKT